jgi:hypothetical protein
MMDRSDITMIPTSHLRFEARMVPLPTTQIGGGVICRQRLILQQMFWENDKQVWIDVPTVPEGKPWEVK